MSGLHMNNKEQNGLQLAATIMISSLFLFTASMESYAASTAEKSKIVAKSKQVSNNSTNSKSTVSQADKSQSTTEASATSTTDDSQASDDAINDELGADETVYNKDPLEKFNRAMFTFNDKLDFYLIKPVAQLYNAIMPKPLNQGVHNFFNNLGEVPTIVNDLLQFNFYQMTKDMCRLGINSTMGIGGLFDMATRMHLPYFQNDFGLTLAAWGYKDSSYLVLPFLGPNTIRDGLGTTLDYFEFTVYPYVEPQSRRYQLLGLYTIDHRANLLQFEPVMEEAAIDKYVFMRNAYMQHRAFQIEQIKHLSYKDRNVNAQDEASS